MRIRRALHAFAVCLALLLVALWFANFVWVVRANGQYGGGALNGVVRDGHYYVGMHGSYTEVSQATWERIRVHEVWMLFGAPLMIASGAYLLLTVVFPPLIGLRRGSEVAERVRLVRDSGERVAAGRCSASIAGMRYGWPFLFVEVYPAGITVRPFLQPPVAIRKDEIRRIDTLKWHRYEVTHASPDLMSPVLLAVSGGSEFPSALEWLARDLPPVSPPRRGMRS